MNPLPPEPPDLRAPRKWNWGLWVIAAIFVCFLCGIAAVGTYLYPRLLRLRAARANGLCIRRLHDCARAISMYAADNDEALPNASSWMDETRSLVRSERSFRCPEAWREGAGAYGYAMNAKLSRVPVGQIDDAGATPLVFDSTLLMRNAGGGTDTVPKKGRHRGGNNVACADGHVEHVAGLFTSRPPRPL